MLALLFLSLLGSVLSVPINPVNSEISVPDEEYILPGTTIPTFYDVSLFLDPRNNETFSGNVLIRFLPNIITSEIVLHAMNMEIKNIQLSTEDNQAVNILSNYTLATDDTHFLRIVSNVTMNVTQPHILRIEYNGTFASNMFGLYVSTYQHESEGIVNLIASQLQPTFARRAFPCFDEPRYKAVFRTTIYAPPQYTVVRTNMPETKNVSKPEVEGYKKYEFEDTPVMSTYLLAFLVSNFEYISNDGNMTYQVPFRIYARPGSQNSSEFALDFGQENMIQLEKYIELPYDLPKIDKAAIPDFAAGAMENWGLVLYREVALLVTEGVTTTSTLQNIGRIISHENMHMWFGNEVSPVNWTYTWLNEGFANFFENYATELVLPQWRMMDQYVLAVQNVLQNDAVLTVNPMTHPVYTPSQIIGTFNSVAYQKSGSVIRMLQHFLTPEIFRKGLVSYIKNNARKAVEPQALYQSLQQAVNGTGIPLPNTIANIMQRWTTQGGFPVLMVRRQAPTAESLSISQQRFLTDPTLTSTTRWYVPVNWVISTNPNFEDTSVGGWVLPYNRALAVDIPGLSNATWFIINKQQTGYYRVNYEDENWLALANVLLQSHNTIHLLNRAQLVDDVFNLARNGRTNYFNAFEVSRYLINETDYIPWGAANSAFNYLDNVLSGTPIHGLFQNYVLELTEPLYNQLGFEAKANEEHVTPFHRNLILNFNCRFGNEKCVQRSKELLEQYQANPSQRLNPDIQTTIFCSALRDGSADTFNFLWQQYRASQESSEQTILLNALGCTSNATLRTFYMNQMIAPDSEVREQDRHTILVAVINSSPAGTEAALDFIIENFAAIQPRVQGLSGTANILTAFSRRLTSRQHSTKIDTFISRHQDIFTAAERAGVASIRENIAASINWSGNNYNKVNNWLRDRNGNSAGIITSSFLIVISIFVTIYNY